MPSTPRFIHLRLHTEYSLLEGAVRLKKLPGLAAGMGMPAVAVTDPHGAFVGYITRENLGEWAVLSRSPPP